MDAPLKVLLVEDSEDDAFLIINMLKSGGYYNIVHSRVDTPEAFTQALDEKSWDIILSDFAMPHFSGMAALKLYQASGLDIPFLIVSGAIGEETAVVAMKAGIHDYVLKDNLTRLLPAIERELQDARERTARKEAEKSLKETKERYRLLVEAVKDYAIIMLDPDGHIKTWNKGAERVHGYYKEEVLGNDFSCFFMDAEEAAHCLKNASRNGRHERECWLVRKNGERIWANFLLTAIYNEYGNLVGFTKITRDMTNLKLAEQEIEDAMLSNLRKDESLISTSHELRSPLHGIIASSSMLLQGMFGELNPKQAEYIAIIKRSGDHLLEIINDLLDIARIDSGKIAITLGDVSPESILEEAFLLTEPLSTEKGQLLSVVMGENLPANFECDSVRLKQILCNLLTNAIKFTPTEKHIWLQCHCGDDNELIFSVKDEGPGFPEYELNKLLQPYEQGDQTNLSNIKGTGLGLYLTRKLVELLDGRLDARSSEGQGSEFFVYLPVKRMSGLGSSAPV